MLMGVLLSSVIIGNSFAIMWIDEEGQADIPVLYFDSTENSQTFLEGELPGHLQSYKNKSPSGSQTSGNIPPDLRLMLQDVSENITPDTVRSLMEDAKVMKRLAELLPTLEAGKMNISDNTVNPNSFEDEISAFTNALRSNGGLGQITRNLGSIKTRVDATDDELSSNDTDSEYVDAEDCKHRADKGEPDPSTYHGQQDHNINDLAAAVAMNVKEKLKCRTTEGLSISTAQQTYKSNEPAKQCIQMSVVVTAGSNENYNEDYKSTGDSGSTSQPKIDLNECGIENYSLEKWESATEPNVLFGHRACDNNIQADGKVIYKRSLSIESSCCYAMQSSCASLVSKDGAVATSSNQNYYGDSNRESPAGRNVLFNEGKAKTQYVTNWISATEPNFHLDHDESGTRNTQTEDHGIYEAVAKENSYTSTRPSFLLSYANESASFVDNKGSLDLDNAVPTTSNRNHIRPWKSVDNRESVRNMHFRERETKTRSLDNWTATEPNSHFDHKTQGCQLEDKVTMATESIGNCDKGCKSTEPYIHIIPSLENWKSDNGPNFHLDCKESETGNLTQTEYNRIHDKSIATDKRFLGVRPSMQVQTSFYENENTSLVDNEGLSPEMRVGSNSTTQVAMGKESISDTCNCIGATSAADMETNEFGQATQITEISRSTESSDNYGSPHGLDHALPVMALQTALATESSSEMGDLSNITEIEEESEDTQTIPSIKISESQTSSTSLEHINIHSSESKHQNGSFDNEGSLQGPAGHICTEVVTLETAMEATAHGKVELSNISDKEGNIEVGQTPSSTPSRSGEHSRSKLQFTQEKTPSESTLGKPDEFQGVLCVSVGVGTTFMQSTSTQASYDESQQPGCSAWAPASSLTPQIAYPKRSVSRGVEVGCGTRSGNPLPPLKLEDILAQPGYSRIMKPMPVESVTTETKSRESVLESVTSDTKSRGSVISVISSKISTLSDNSEGSEDDEGDHANKEITDLSKPETNTLEDKYRVTTENRAIVNKNTGSSVGVSLDENDDTTQDEKSHTNTIAMIVLSASGKNIDKDTKQANNTLGSGLNESPQGPAETGGNKEENIETASRPASNTIGAGATSSRQRPQDPESAKPNRNGKNINNANKTLRSSMNDIPQRSADTDGKEQANIEIASGPVSNTIGGTATSSRLSPHDPESAKPNRKFCQGRRALQRTSPELTKSKKPAALNLAVSKSLEEVIDVRQTTKHCKEQRYNLRKRPQQRVETSLSGPMNTCPDGSGKRVHISLPEVLPPLPFRVPEASPVRSNLSIYPQSSGSKYLGTPNQEGRDQNLRKRPTEDVDLPDSEEDAPPFKKARTSNSNNSKAGPSRPEGLSSGSEIKTRASGSSGSVSTPGRSLTLNKNHSKAGTSRPEGQSSGSEIKTRASGSSGNGSIPGQSLIGGTSRGPLANHNPSKGSPQIADSSPRYNLRRRSDPAKTEDEQQTEPVRIREIKKTGPETRVRARANPQSATPRVQRVDRTIRDVGQNTRPVLIEDKRGSKSKTKDRKPSEPDGNPKP